MLAEKRKNSETPPENIENPDDILKKSRVQRTYTVFRIPYSVFRIYTVNSIQYQEVTARAYMV